MGIDFMEHAPASVAEAVEILFNSLTPEETEGVKETTAAAHHHTFGMAMRNHWRLWFPESPIAKSCLAQYGVSMADDISGLILGGLWARVRGEEFDFQAEANGYRAHWIELGCDPATGKDEAR